MRTKLPRDRTHEDANIKTWSGTERDRTKAIIDIIIIIIIIIISLCPACRPLRHNSHGVLPIGR